MRTRTKAAVRPPPAVGIEPRRRAAELVEQVLIRKRPLDEGQDGPEILSPADRGLARRIAATTLRRLGSVDRLLAARMRKPLPEGLPRLETALRIGAAQILFLDVPDHAAVDTAVALVDADRKARGLTGFANGVLRGLAREREDLLAVLDPLDDLPDWLKARWIASFGVDTARAIATIQAHDPPLDLSVKHEAGAWADRLGGVVTATGSVRLKTGTAIPDIDGFGEGQWWVQDAAAALPARLFGDVAGLAVADLCAAPGGKTAQLAVAGARVTAFDRSAPRMARLVQNMARLGLAVETRIADATGVQGPFDAVLIDAPCSATGTIRRHPDVMHLKSEADLANLVALQARLIDRAVALTRPGGRIVYCTCSLEREEGEQQIAAALARHADLARDPIGPGDVQGVSTFLDDRGQLRTLPSHWPENDPAMAGLDGFFAARLLRG